MARREQVHQKQRHPVSAFGTDRRGCTGRGEPVLTCKASQGSWATCQGEGMIQAIALDLNWQVLQLQGARGARQVPEHRTLPGTGLMQPGGNCSLVGRREVNDGRAVVNRNGQPRRRERKSAGRLPPTSRKTQAGRSKPLVHFHRATNRATPIGSRAAPHQRPSIVAATGIGIEGKW